MCAGAQWSIVDQSTFRGRAAAMCMATSLFTAVIFSTTVQAAEPGLTTGPWSIVEMGGKPIRPAATINFRRIRWLGVKTPCGTLWGWYRQSASALNIHIAGRGRWGIDYGSPCRGIDYQLLLGRVRSFTLDADRLLLRTGSGQTIAILMRQQ
jgi:hypothetical protein